MAATPGSAAAALMSMLGIGGSRAPQDRLADDVRRLNALACPVLAMHSDEADIILDWKQVSRWSHTLGSKVSVRQFPGGLHDLVLSRREVRDEVFTQLFAWAERVEG